MLPVIVLLTLFGALPVLCGFFESIRCSHERRTWYIARIHTLESWSILEWSLTFFVASTAVLYVAAFSTTLGFRLSFNVYMVLLFLSPLTAFVYLCCYFKVLEITKKYGWLLKILLGAAVIGVAAASKTYADAAIAELTGLPPQNLPGAQILLSFMLSPIIWFIGLSLVLGLLSGPVMAFLLVKVMYLDFVKSRHSGGNQSNFPEMIALLAVALFSIIALTTTQKIASKGFYEVKLRQAIEFASFQLSATYCGFPENKGVGVAIMPDDLAAIAIPNEKAGYIFEVISCKPTVKSDEQIRASLNDVGSDKKL